MRGPCVLLPPPRSPWAGLPFVEPGKASAMSPSHRPEEGTCTHGATRHAAPPQRTPPNVSPLSALPRREGTPPHSVYEVPAAGEIILRRKVVFQKPGQIENQKPAPLNPADQTAAHRPLGALGGQHTMLHTNEETRKARGTAGHKARETERAPRKPRNPDDEGGLERRAHAYTHSRRGAFFSQTRGGGSLAGHNPACE